MRRAPVSTHHVPLLPRSLVEAIKKLHYVCRLAVGFSGQQKALLLLNYLLCSVVFEARVNIMPNLHPTFKFTH